MEIRNGDRMKLSVKPPDKDLIVNGRLERCKATGYVVMDGTDVYGYPMWWNEYRDAEGHTHLGTY